MKTETEHAGVAGSDATLSPGASEVRGSPSRAEAPKLPQRRWPIVVCIVVYIALAVFEFGWSNTLGSGRMAGPGSADQIIDIWWIAWAQFALSHGHNLFFSDWQNFPVGLNAVVNTSMLGLGVLASPITSAFGPIVSWNVLERAALVLSACSMCFVMRRWTSWWPAAFQGGLLYGFSVYETSSVAHLNVSFVPLLPLFFLMLHEGLVRQRWRASVVGGSLGLICAFQYLISSEFLTSMVVFGAIATVLYVLANRRTFRSAWPYARRALVFAIFVGGVLLAAPVLYTLAGPGHVNGVPNSPQNLALLHGDFLGAFVPGYLERFTVPSLLAGYHFNSGAMYLGVPFILSIGIVTVVLRRRGIVAMAGTLAAIAFVLSLGSTLYVDGYDTRVPLPFTFLAHLPLLDGLLAVRLALYTGLFGAAVVSVGIDTLRARVAGSRSLSGRSHWQRNAIASATCLGVAAIVAVPLLPADAQLSSRSDTPSFFSSPMTLRDIPSDSAVLAYPYPDAPVFPGSEIGYSYSPRYQAINDVLLDQAASGLRFKLIGGYGWRPDNGADSISSSPTSPTSVQDLFDFAFYGVTTRAGQVRTLTTNNLAADIRLFLKRYDVSTVIVLPVGHDPATVRDALAAAIGAPTHFGGAAAWFDVPRRLKFVSATKVFRVAGSPPVTRIGNLKSGEEIAGHHYLAASAIDSFGIKSVSFELSGQRSFEATICHAVPFAYGYICNWDSTNVPNGTYTLRSVAISNTGQTSRSAAVFLHVENEPRGP